MDPDPDRDVSADADVPIRTRRNALSLPRAEASVGAHAPMRTHHMAQSSLQSPPLVLALPRILGMAMLTLIINERTTRTRTRRL